MMNTASAIAESNIPAETCDGKAFRKTMDVNLIGAFILNQAVARVMIKNNSGGSIINIASMSGSIVNYPQPQCAYNASKAGVIMLTKCLAAEWAQHHIRVNTISPGQNMLLHLRHLSDNSGDSTGATPYLGRSRYDGWW